MNVTNEKKMKKKIGYYSIKKKLGEGAAAVVYKGYNSKWKQKVAIKVIEKAIIKKKPDIVPKIKKEISIMKLFFHPHVLKIIDVLEDRKCVYLILEYCIHGDFLGYINKKRDKKFGFRDQEILRFFKQMIGGLEYIHAHNICHLDLKPENMLLGSNYQLKIADFGLSLGYQKNLKDFAGTVNYSSPEVLESKPFDGKISDMWSIGASLYVFSVGSLPYEDDFDRAKKILRQIKTKFPYLPSYLSNGCKKMLRSLLKIPIYSRINIEQIKLNSWYNLKKLSRTCFLISPDLNLRIFNAEINKDLAPRVFTDVLNLGIEKDDLSCFHVIYSFYKTQMRIYYYQFIWCSLARKKDLHRHLVKTKQKNQMKKKIKKYLAKKISKIKIKKRLKNITILEMEKFQKEEGTLFESIVEIKPKNVLVKKLWKFLSRRKKEIKRERDLYNFQKNKNKKEKIEKIHEMRQSQLQKKIEKEKNALRSELIKLKKIDMKIDFRKLKRKISKKINKKKKLSSRHVGKIIKIERGNDFGQWDISLKRKRKKKKNF